MQTNDFSNLPNSWQIKTLGEVCEITMGQSPLGEKVINKKQNTNSKALEFHQGKICFTDKFITESEVVTTDIRKVAQSNSILLCVRAPVGIINITQRQIAIGRGLCALNFKDKNSNNDFLYFYLLTLKNYFNEKATGSTFSAINLDTIKNTKIPLPPLEIQKCIVARLESAFEKIEKGSAHLQDAKTKLAKYKQSLLKSAFDGTLTAAASLQGVEKAETIHKVDCHKSANANFHNDDKSVDCHDLTSSNLAMTDKENPKLPQGWTIKTLGEVCEINPKNKLDDDLEVSFIPMNLILDKFQNKFSYETKIWKNIKKGYTHFQNNCIALAKITPCFENGKCVILDNLKNGYGAGTTELIILLPNLQETIAKYIFYFLNTQNFIEQGKRNFKGTAGQLRISADFVANCKIPLPPLETQKQIVKLLEKHLQHADKTGKFIESALNKAKQLKQSLLKSAFLGKLT